MVTSFQNRLWVIGDGWCDDPWLRCFWNYRKALIKVAWDIQWGVIVLYLQKPLWCLQKNMCFIINLLACDQLPLGSRQWYFGGGVSSHGPHNKISDSEQLCKFALSRYVAETFWIDVKWDLEARVRCAASFEGNGCNSRWGDCTAARATRPWERTFAKRMFPTKVLPVLPGPLSIKKSCCWPE